MAGGIEATGPDLAAEGVPSEEIGGDRPFAARVGDDPVVVVRRGDTVHVLGAKCTHYGTSLAGGICVDNELRCPQHHATFDIATGEAVGAPALDPIPVYAVSERGGRVYVEGTVEAPTVKPSPQTRPESVVVVGSGAAGAAAVEALRRHGYDGPITLIGQEPPVDRPNLSKDYLAGSAPEEWIPLRGEDFYSDADITLRSGHEVTSIDREARTVTLDDGSVVPYGALLLATGAEPRRPPIPGADQRHVHYLRTLDDSRRIIDATESAKQVCVVGAGFIGLEVAGALRARDIDVVVVAPEEIPLERIIGGALGEWVRDLHAEHGVQFRLGRGVERIDEHDVTLDDGEVVGADVVVMGVGVAPRTALAEAAGLAVDNGIEVDATLRTSDPHIWAAGDVARYPDPEGDPIRVEHWVLAERQGQVAAANMLGANTPFEVPPFFWSEHHRVTINVTGWLDGWDEVVMAGDPGEQDVIVGFRRGGVIRAVATIGRDVANLEAERALERNDQTALEALFAQ